MYVTFALSNYNMAPDEKVIFYKHIPYISIKTYILDTRLDSLWRTNPNE